MKQHLFILFAAIQLLFTSPSIIAQEIGSPMLREGNQEFAVAGFAKLSGDSDIDLELKYGWFVQDNWEVGVTLGSHFYDDNLRVQGGMFTEYNFYRQSPWVPFVGASMELASVNFNDTHINAQLDEDAKSFVLGIDFGVKYFFRPGIAITGSAGFNYAVGDSVFGAIDDAKDAAADIDIGLRVYF